MPAILQNEFGKTPLDYCMQRGTRPDYLVIMETLIKAGAGKQ